MVDEKVSEEDKVKKHSDAIPPVLTDKEADEILVEGIAFSQKPTSIGEVHRRIQRDADVKFIKGYLRRTYGN